MWLGLVSLLAVQGGLLAQLRTSPSVAEFPRDVVKTLYVKNGGTRGTWQAPDFCPVGTYASGFRIKVTIQQGQGHFFSVPAQGNVCEFLIFWQNVRENEILSGKIFEISKKVRYFL